MEPRFVDYPAWNRELKKRKTAITRAWDAGDWPRVVSLCVGAKEYFDTIMWPDNWPWYNIKFKAAQSKTGVHWSEVKDFDDL